MPTIVQQIKREIANQFKGELTEARSDAAKTRNELSKARKELSKARKEKEETAGKLLHKGMDLDSIAEVTGIPREKLNQMFH